MFQVSITEFGHPHPSYQCITVIRALASKDVNLESYKKLLSLESHCDRINSHELSNIVRFIKRFFKTDDISEEEMRKIVGILQVEIQSIFYNCVINIKTNRMSHIQ